MKKIEHVSLKEGVEAGKLVCEKAMEVINFRLQSERFEIWKAMINLQFYFASDPLELKTLIQKSLSANPKAEVMEHVLLLCKQSERIELGEEYSEIYLKKSNSKEDAWLRYLQYLLESKAILVAKGAKENKDKMKSYELTPGLEEEVSEEAEMNLREKVKGVLRRSLQSLPKHRHVYFLSRYAVQEYRNGENEIGKTNFENLVSGFPNRMDLWKIYLDMEIKYFKGNLEGVRELFERVLALPKMKMKVAKGIFKLYVLFEDKHGTAKRVRMVKDKAVEFVKAKTA